MWKRLGTYMFEANTYFKSLYVLPLFKLQQYWFICIKCVCVRPELILTVFAAEGTLL